MATQTFSGIEYPDDAASDPARLCWMQGNPTEADKLIRYADDRFLEFPQIRWTLSHMRELLPTANVWRGSATRAFLGTSASADAIAIDTLQFDDLTGVSRRFDESLAATYTDGIVILHRGRLVYERYRGVLRPELQHACFSITKSLVGTLAAGLIYEGVLEADLTVSSYLPEMVSTAYADATLRQVLDMQVGVAYSEDYSDPNSPFWAYARAGGFRPRTLNYDGPDSFYQYLMNLRKVGEHGSAFTYRTVDTEVLSWVMSRVTGVSLAGLLTQRLWSRMGCEQDAYLAVDSTGVGMGGAGLAATLRDIACYGELLRCDGASSANQIIPAAVVADIRRGADREKFASAGYNLLTGYSYRNMWWVTHNEHQAFEARGIHGQRLYVAPGADMVVARFASHPIATSAANDPITMPALLALGRLLRDKQMS